MIKLYSAPVCPFAQRPRALLAHLGKPFEQVDVDLRDRDPELLRLSPTGKVPCLVDGDLMLYESQAINDYLAERFEWRKAYSEDPRVRARQRLLMSRWDLAITPPAFYRAMKDPESFDDEGRARVRRELDELERTVAMMDGEAECLMGFHVAPFWARARWLARYVPLIAMVEDRPDLAAWLDRTAALPSIQQTLPEREWTIEQYERDYVAGGR